MTCLAFWLTAAAAFGMTAGTALPADSLNVTLQLTTRDFLPVSTVIHAAASVWGVSETDIQILTATAQHASDATTTHARKLLEAKSTAEDIQLEIAAKQNDSPVLLKWKESLESSHQAPESPSDILGLLQAFADFEEGSDPEPVSQQTRALTTVSSGQSGQQSSPLSDIHPHLLFLKTGGGATVAQPKRHLTPQQLQVLADGSGTLEGLTVRNAYDRPTVPHAKVATLQQQGPLGIATVVLESDQDSNQQLASLFTPRNDQAAGNTAQGVSQSAARSIFSAEAEHQGTDAVAKAAMGRLDAAAQSGLYSMPDADSFVRPGAKSLQGVYLDQPRVEEAGFAALKSALTESRLKDPVDPMLSLSWLDEPMGQDASNSKLKPALQQLPRPSTEEIDQQIIARSSVLLTLKLSVASNHTQALQEVISSSLLSRALQQQIAREGFHVSKLDASFDRQSVFSSRNGAFFVQIAESKQDGSKSRMKVSVRTTVQPSTESIAETAPFKNDQVALQAAKDADTSSNSRNSLQPWDLMFCIGVLAVAVAGLVLGIYKFSVSRAGRQAYDQLTCDSKTSVWLCGQNSLHEPLIPRATSAAEDSC